MRISLWMTALCLLLCHRLWIHLLSSIGISNLSTARPGLRTAQEKRLQMALDRLLIRFCPCLPHFFLEAFLGLGAVDDAASLDDPTAGTADGVEGPAEAVAAEAAGFFLGFLGFASTPSVFGFADFFGFGAAALGV